MIYAYAESGEVLRDIPLDVTHHQPVCCAIRGCDPLSESPEQTTEVQFVFFSSLHLDLDLSDTRKCIRNPR